MERLEKDSIDLSKYGAQNETYNDGKDVKWWNALSAKELRV